MTRKQKESKIFDLKPKLTLAMKLAATFAITYYGLLFLYEVLTLVMYHYSLDSYYLGNGEVLENQSKDFVYLIAEFLLTGLLVFSLILIFRTRILDQLISCHPRFFCAKCLNYSDINLGIAEY